MPTHRSGKRWGITTVTASTNGNATIAHGLGVAPSGVFVTMTGDTTVHVDVQAYDAGTLTLRFKSAATGADVTSGDFAVSWLVLQ